MELIYVCWVHLSICDVARLMFFYWAFGHIICNSNLMGWNSCSLHICSYLILLCLKYLVFLNCEDQHFNWVVSASYDVCAIVINLKQWICSTRAICYIQFRMCGKKKKTTKKWEARRRAESHLNWASFCIHYLVSI